MMRGRKTSCPANAHLAFRHDHERKEAHNVVEGDASPQTGKGLFGRAVRRAPGRTALELSDAQGREFGRERAALPQEPRRLVKLQACHCRSPQATLECGGLTPLSRSPWVPSALRASAKRSAVLTDSAAAALHTTAVTTHKQTLEATLVSLQVSGSRSRVKARGRDQQAVLRHSAVATSYHDADRHAIRRACVTFLEGGGQWDASRHTGTTGRDCVWSGRPARPNRPSSGIGRSARVRVWSRAYGAPGAGERPRSLVRSEEERSRPAARTGGRDQQAVSPPIPVPVRGRKRVGGTSKQRCGAVPRQHLSATQTDTRSVESASGFCTVNKEDAYGVKQWRVMSGEWAAGSRQKKRARRYRCWLWDARQFG